MNIDERAYTAPELAAESLKVHEETGDFEKTHRSQSLGRTNMHANFQRLADQQGDGSMKLTITNKSFKYVYNTLNSKLVRFHTEEEGNKGAPAASDQASQHVNTRLDQGVDTETLK